MQTCRRVLFALGASLFLLPGTAAAEHVERFALVVGSNHGTITDQPLRYAEADAASLAAVLRYLGGFPRGTLTELYTPSGDQLLDAVRRLAVQVRTARDAGSNVLLLFYFSGHSDGDALRTGGDLVPFAYLRRAFKASGAPVRLIVVDACRAGALTRRKGATEAPPVEVRAFGDLATEGEAFIASTTSDELARESALLRGSFFTHHFVTGLRGAADRSGDGKVTLAEAYDYAYSRTVVEAVGEQHPTYSFDLSGRGDVVLTSLQDASAALHFEPGPASQFIITDEQSGRVVAEVKVSPEAGLRLALPPGRYALRYGDTANPQVRNVELGPGQVVEIPPAQRPIRVVPSARAGEKSGEHEARAAEPTPAQTLPPAPPAHPMSSTSRRAQLIVGLGLGMAPVWVPGGTSSEVAYQLRSDPSGGRGLYQPASVDGNGGIATAWLHLRLELGVRLAERWDLVVALRAQVYVGATAETRSTEDGSPPFGGTQKSKGAIAGLVRARYRFLRGPVTPFVEVAVGGGEVRPAIDLGSAQTADKPLVDQATATAYNNNPTATINRQLVCPSSSSCVDSIRLGPGLAGAGLGVQLELLRRGHTGLSLTLSTTLLGAFGNGNRGLVGDFDLGLLARLL